KPIPTLTTYIMDKNMKLLPVGVPGEICVGGKGVGRGYLNREELTGEKFVKNPYKGEERLYRSGDLARWLPDGNIEYLGRIDNQVKIRGHRIELGEIENRLLKHEAVKEAVLLCKRDKDKNDNLIAYLVAERDIKVAELREHISKSLPAYMIPAYFIMLENIPVTPNGKVDTDKLPDIDASEVSEAEYVAPRTDVEKNIIEVWKSVLGAKNIGINHNFFELGGDSIKAIQVISRLLKYDLKLEVRDLFKHPRIAELSGIIRHDGKTAEQGTVVGEIPLTPIQRRFFRLKIADINRYNHSVMLYFRDGINEDIVSRIFTKIIEHHDALRMVFKLEEDRVIQFNRGIEEELFELKVIDVKDDPEFEKRIENEADALQGSINISEGPLVKLGLFKTGQGDHLLIIIHHLVVDGVSWRIISEDFINAYRQIENSEEIVFQDKTSSYREWGKKLVDYAQSREIQEEIKYWKSIRNFGLTTLPKDGSENEKGNEKKTRKFLLSGEETEKLLKKAGKAYNTEINDILLTALGLSVKAWTGRNNVLVGLEGHGREGIFQDIDVTKTVGWFTSIYPVILDVTDDEVSSCIKNVKESLRRIPNRGIGYGIIKYLYPTDEDQIIPEVNPEISFNYLGQFDNDVNYDIFEVSHLNRGIEASQEIEREYSIDINGLIIDGRLSMSIAYETEKYSGENIQRLTDCFRKNLQDIIGHCINKTEREITPSDIGNLEVSIEDFESILNKIKDI
uniref:condensation domain-containing protein n=1 Tax=Ruminiclostridium cellobioparum TaxID=29355 RepID=UPI00048A10AB